MREGIERGKSILRERERERGGAEFEWKKLFYDRKKGQNAKNRGNDKEA